MHRRPTASTLFPRLTAVFCTAHVHSSSPSVRTCVLSCQLLASPEKGVKGSCYENPTQTSGTTSNQVRCSTADRILPDWILLTQTRRWLPCKRPPRCNFSPLFVPAFTLLLIPFALVLEDLTCSSVAILSKMRFAFGLLVCLLFAVRTLCL